MHVPLWYVLGEYSVNPALHTPVLLVKPKRIKEKSWFPFTVEQVRRSETAIVDVGMH